MLRFLNCLSELLPSPTLMSISPTQGLVNGGAIITISGTNFTNATGVFFDAIAVISFSIDSDTQIIAISPAAKFSGIIDGTVTTPNSPSPINIVDQLIYIAE